MLGEHWEQVKQIYESGIATGIATFKTSAPSWENWDKAHLNFSRLVATINNEVVGWAALSPVSSRCVYGGLAWYFSNISLFIFSYWVDRT